MNRNKISRTARAHQRGVAALSALAGALILAAPAAATTTSTTTSSNWSGYAAHGSSTRFSDVSGRWRVPAATCQAGEQTFSSFWVGIGGYDRNSTGLEQDGTELDCNADGSETVSAWYELLPAAPHTVSLAVHSGDLMSASVQLSGEEVTLKITDLSTHRSFTKTVRDTDVDDTSAEWIAEAPSECTGDSDSDCEVLALADFGSVRFSNASATTTAGVTSGISTRKWTTTKLLLGYEDSADGDFIAESDRGDATPSALTGAGHGFTVTWSGATSTSGSSGTGTSGSSGTGTGGAGSGPNPGGGGGFSGGPGPGGGSSDTGPGDSARRA